jgi:UDP-sulfoquinovose synthase
MKLQDARVLILGMDGYLGWSLYCYLRDKVHSVTGLDNFSRRRHVHEIGSESLFPLPSETGVDSRPIHQHDLVYNPLKVQQFIESFHPTTIIHFAEQPSAPFSMRNSNSAAVTQRNNVVGSLNLLWMLREHPHIHLVKLGTMGEYSDWIYKNNVEIPEANRIEVQYQNTDITIPTPRWAGSFYHWSKVFDSFNLEFACRLWGLSATDLNQGVVYGTRILGMADNELTRFDYDSYFGTVVNRFIVQSISDYTPLTVYGSGKQTRGYININDTMRAISLAIQNPPPEGTCKIVNQLTEVFSVNEIALMVQQLTGCEIESIDNPRLENEEHTYNPTFNKLEEWGLSDPFKMEQMLHFMVEDVKPFASRILMDVIAPETKWTGKYYAS